MAIDYSTSITDEEMGWQVGGLIEVFSNPDTAERIRLSTHGAIAVCVYRFGSAAQEPFIPWTVLRAGDGSIPAFVLALQIEAAADRDQIAGGISGGTMVSAAVTAGHRLLLQWPHAGRLILDIQTDGPEGDKPTGPVDALVAARDATIPDAVLINVLVIGDDARRMSLTDYHLAYTATGMVWDARDGAGYLAAIQAKLYSEIW